MNLDEVVEEARRVSQEYGKVIERQRVIAILNYCMKQTKSAEANAMLLIVKDTVLENEESPINVTEDRNSIKEVKKE